MYRLIAEKVLMVKRWASSSEIGGSTPPFRSNFSTLVHIEEILTEASAIGCRNEVKQYAELLLETDSFFSPVKAYNEALTHYLEIYESI
jgi:hypothetical protein